MFLKKDDKSFSFHFVEPQWILIRIWTGFLTREGKSCDGFYSLSRGNSKLMTLLAMTSLYFPFLPIQIKWKAWAWNRLRENYLQANLALVIQLYEHSVIWFGRYWLLGFYHLPRFHIRKNLWIRRNENVNRHSRQTYTHI